MRKNDFEQGKFFRAGTRFFRVDSQWFYTTREGDEGPFPSEEAAERHLKSYLDLQNLKDNQKTKVEKIREERKPVDPSVWGKYESL